MVGLGVTRPAPTQEGGVEEDDDGAVPPIGGKSVAADAAMAANWRDWGGGAVAVALRVGPRRIVLLDL